MRSAPERRWPLAAAYEELGAPLERWEKVIVVDHSDEELGRFEEEKAQLHAMARETDELATEHTALDVEMQPIVGILIYYRTWGNLGQKLKLN